MKNALERLGVGALVLGLAACGGDPAPKSPADQASTTASPATSGGAATLGSFAKASNSLQVDKVGGSDGALTPDGNPDAAYTLDVEGPITAFVITSVDASGKPTPDFQTDTFVGDQKLPADLASSIAEGKHTAGIGVFEGDKALNAADGSVSVPAGKHSLTLYFANTGVLQPGASLRVYGVTADGKVVTGPVATF